MTDSAIALSGVLARGRAEVEGLTAAAKQCRTEEDNVKWDLEHVEEELRMAQFKHRCTSFQAAKAEKKMREGKAHVERVQREQEDGLE